MIAAHAPARQIESALPAAGLPQFIDACLECEIACSMCVDACLQCDGGIRVARCIRTGLDTADLCGTSARIFSRRTAPCPAILRSQLETVTTACRVFAHECEVSADIHEQCMLCAHACRRCEAACRRLALVL